MHAAAVERCCKFGGCLKQRYFQGLKYSYMEIMASGKINFIYDPSRCVFSIYYNKSPSINTTIS